ncbi:hypothetical protein BGY98DRAFT_938414 [Russula aff. rugulosa BPL654]|nr:hypothetical protein BGY98DRAFT_938414 [Russula aff. rugulosa BPL654]
MVYIQMQALFKKEDNLLSKFKTFCRRSQHIYPAGWSRQYPSQSTQRMQVHPAQCGRMKLRRRLLVYQKEPRSICADKNESSRKSLLDRPSPHTWRQVDARNFYKSLDYMGINFKQNDKKTTTTKAFVVEIEGVRKEQEDQARKEARARARPACTCGCQGFQLTYLFADSGVLIGVEYFPRAFMPLLCMLPPAMFNAACGPLEIGVEEDSGDKQQIDEGPAHTCATAGGACADGGGGGLRKNAAVQEKYRTIGGGSRVSTLADGREMVNVRFFREEPSFQLVLINEFYIWLLLYSRLSSCKEEGREHGRQKFWHLAANPIAVEHGRSTGPVERAVCVGGTLRMEQNKHVGVPDLKFLLPVNIRPVMSSPCNTCVTGTRTQSPFEDTKNILVPASEPARGKRRVRVCKRDFTSCRVLLWRCHDSNIWLPKANGFDVLYSNYEYTFLDSQRTKDMQFVQKHLRMKHVIIFKLNHDVLQVALDLPSSSPPPPPLPLPSTSRVAAITSTKPLASHPSTFSASSVFDNVMLYKTTNHPYLLSQVKSLQEELAEVKEEHNTFASSESNLECKYDPEQLAIRLIQEIASFRHRVDDIERENGIFLALLRKYKPSIQVSSRQGRTNSHWKLNFVNPDQPDLLLNSNMTLSQQLQLARDEADRTSKELSTSRRILPSTAMRSILLLLSHSLPTIHYKRLVPRRKGLEWSGRIAEQDATYTSEVAGSRRLIEMVENYCREAALREQMERERSRSEAAETCVEELERILEKVNRGEFPVPTPGPTLPLTPARGPADILTQAGASPRDNNHSLPSPTSFTTSPVGKGPRPLPRPPGSSPTFPRTTPLKCLMPTSFKSPPLLPLQIPSLILNNLDLNIEPHSNGSAAFATDWALPHRRLPSDLRPAHKIPSGYRPGVVVVSIRTHPCQLLDILAIQTHFSTTYPFLIPPLPLVLILNPGIYHRRWEEFIPTVPNPLGAPCKRGPPSDLQALLDPAYLITPQPPILATITPSLHLSSSEQPLQSTSTVSTSSTYMSELERNLTVSTVATTSTLPTTYSSSSRDKDTITERNSMDCRDSYSSKLAELSPGPIPLDERQRSESARSEMTTHLHLASNIEWLKSCEAMEGHEFLPE